MLQAGRNTVLFDDQNLHGQSDIAACSPLHVFTFLPVFANTPHRTRYLRGTSCAC